MAVTSRELGALLDGLGEAEQYLVAVHMALRKFAHYTQDGTKVVVHVPLSGLPLIV